MFFVSWIIFMWSYFYLDNYVCMDLWRCIYILFVIVFLILSFCVGMFILGIGVGIIVDIVFNVEFNNVVFCEVIDC